jgi:hypothetical protein
VACGTEAGNHGGAVLRHNDDIALVEDLDVDSESGKARPPIAPPTALKKKARASVTPARGGTNTAARDGGVVSVSGQESPVVSNLASVDMLQSKADHLLSKLETTMFGGHLAGGVATGSCSSSDIYGAYAMPAYPAPAPAAKSSYTFEQEMEILAAKKDLMDKELRKAELELELQKQQRH